MAGAIQRVIKLGGSLLELPDLPSRLRRWLTAQSPLPTLLLVGGGRLADVVRDYDQLYRLGDEAAHWLAVQTMSLHASLLAALLPEAELRSSFSASAATDGRLLIFDPYDFLRHDEPRLPGEPLARHWDVTSDSIAARLASACEADELVLLKSAAPPTHGDLSTIDLSIAVARRYFDGCFARAARGLTRIRCINFRDDSFSEAMLVVPADSMQAERPRLPDQLG